MAGLVPLDERSWVGQARSRSGKTARLAIYLDAQQSLVRSDARQVHVIQRYCSASDVAKPGSQPCCGYDVVQPQTTHWRGIWLCAAKTSVLIMDRPKRLTARQLHCLARRDQHFTNKEIARELEVSPATVAMHLYIARQKLRATKRKGGGVHREDEPLAPTGVEGQSEPVEMLWSDLVVAAAAVAMLWLTILGILALLTSPLIDR